MSPPAEAPSTDESIGSSDVAELERIDWQQMDGPRHRLPLELGALLVGLLAVAAAYLYHRRDGGAYLVAKWQVEGADWLLMVAAVVVLAGLVLPAARNRRETRRLLARLSGRWPTVLCLAFVLTVLAGALYALVSGLEPRLGLEIGTAGPDRFQPPVGFSGNYGSTRYDCVGYVTEGSGRDRSCFGTWLYPLGTDRWGYDMIDLLLLGARPVLYATVVTVGLIAPLATAVGLVAGYYGGLVDDLLMAYVDIQLSVPAIVVYLVVFMFVLNSMFVFLVAFGLLSWGGIARIVRSETLQRREEGYVLAARALGGSRPYVLRRHVFPNVSNSVVPATFHLIAVIVLTDAGLSFLGFQPSFQSWGMTIGEGLFRGGVTGAWWNWLFPSIALALTVLALKIAGDGVRDVLDPRGSR